MVTHTPCSVRHGGQVQLLCYLRHAHCIGQVLLVRKDQQHRVLELLLGQEPVQLLLALGKPLTIVAVDDKDDHVRSLIVVPVQWSLHKHTVQESCISCLCTIIVTKVYNIIATIL